MGAGSPLAMNSLLSLSVGTISVCAEKRDWRKPGWAVRIAWRPKAADRKFMEANSSRAASCDGASMRFLTLKATSYFWCTASSSFRRSAVSSSCTALQTSFKARVGVGDPAGARQIGHVTTLWDLSADFSHLATQALQKVWPQRRETGQQSGWKQILHSRSSRTISILLERTASLCRLALNRASNSAMCLTNTSLSGSSGQCPVPPQAPVSPQLQLR